MKLDSKEKYERIRKFVVEIKSHPNIEPFLMTEDIAKYGIYDFCYITKNPGAFSKIDKKLKESKYDFLEEFTEELRQVFIAVADYAFEGDPIQDIVQAFQSDIKRFASQFKEVFDSRPSSPESSRYKRGRSPSPHQRISSSSSCDKHPPPPLPPQPDRPPNLTQKLQMLFLLRNNQNNESYIRSIGKAYAMGDEVGDEYVITIDNKNPFWTQFISKND